MVIRKTVACALASSMAWLPAAPARAVCDTAQPTQTPNGRYVVKGGTVYDKKSALLWQRCSVGQRWQEGAGCVGEIKYLTWPEAMQEASDGWRVPTLDELKTLISPTCQNPAINARAFPDMQLDKIVYWTSTEIHGAFSWYVVFGDGSTYYNYRTGTGAVRLVRGASSYGPAIGKKLSSTSRQFSSQ